MEIKNSVKNPHQKSKKVTPTPSNTPVPSAPIRQKEFASNLQKVMEETKDSGKMVAGLERELRQLKTHDLEVDSDGDDDDDDDGSDSYAKSHRPLSFLVRRRTNALKNIDDEISRLEHHYREQILAVERQFDKKIAECIKKQESIISGEREPTDKETQRDDEEEDSDESPNDISGDSDQIKGVPNYWLHAIENHPILKTLIEEHDRPVLEYLDTIKSVMLKDNPGFKLEFIFRKNPFFDNRSLSREFLLTNPMNFSPGVDFEFQDTVGCNINWKPGKNVTKQTIKSTRPRGNRRGSNTRGPNRTQQKDVDSFFRFFIDSDHDSEDSDSNSIYELQENYEVGTLFRSLTRHSVQYFTGAVVDDSEEYEDYDDYGNFDDFEEEEDDDDDDDENYSDDEAEDDVKEKEKHGLNHQNERQRGGYGSSRSSEIVPPSTKFQGQQKPPECNQQ